MKINDELLKEVKILYVEDDEDVMDGALKFLKRRFTTVYSALNGKEGLEVFKEKNPDIVITDIQMPVMDGLQMAEEIKKISNDTPVIITTAFSDVPYLMKAIELEIDGYIQKPIRHENLFDTICKFAARRKMEDELFKAKKLESIGILAAGIAHDFNNILTPILGHISLAKAEIAPDDKIYKNLDAAEKASFMAKDLVQRFMVFAKGGEPVKRVISIKELIKDASQFLPNSKAECEFNIAEDLWSVEADSGQIFQTVHNVVLNACEAMPDGGIVSISAENVVIGKKDNLPIEDGMYVKVSVRDRGVGIPENLLPKIFDPYFTTKGMDSRKGTGLGLATAYSIVKRHGGYISVESEAGVGTVFHIYLPAV
jgi:signal transduction histidine kinase